YRGYKFTNKTWDTLLKVGILCSSKMYIVALIGRSNLDNECENSNINYWIESLKHILINIY
ncbi:MAG: hypothetical protein ACRC3Y_15720, partial [Romboutsia sp.]|uniref:hypothetical protein n=1 Tax=Romboutsia sp. TaxID=1965302 RepID=UPI003F36F55E